MATYSKENRVKRYEKKKHRVIYSTEKSVGTYKAKNKEVKK